MPTFDGDHLTFLGFLSSFDLAYADTSWGEQLEALLAHAKKEPHRLIAHFRSMSNKERAYNSAIRVLEDTWNVDKVLAALSSRAYEWPPITTAADLIEFGQLLDDVRRKMNGEHS